MGTTGVESMELECGIEDQVKEENVGKENQQSPVENVIQTPTTIEGFLNIHAHIQRACWR